MYPPQGLYYELAPAGVCVILNLFAEKREG